MIRRNDDFERALVSLQRIERTAEARRAEDARFRCSDSARTWAEQETERWRVMEIVNTIKYVPGGIEALLEYANEIALARLADLHDEQAERRRQAASAEAERCALARAQAETQSSPVDALRLLPRAADISNWLKSQTALLRGAYVAGDNREPHA